MYVCGGEKKRKKERKKCRVEDKKRGGKKGIKKNEILEKHKFNSTLKLKSVSIFITIFSQ